MSKRKLAFDVLYYKKNKTDVVFSHSYKETWEPTDYFCPGCGKKSVWHEISPGDYYVGEQYLCTDCGSTFYLPSGVDYAVGAQNHQRLDILRASQEEK